MIFDNLANLDKYRALIPQISLINKFLDGHNIQQLKPGRYELGGEKRIVLKFPKNLAPIRVAVFPLVKNKPELVDRARGIYENLKKSIPQTVWDDNGNIGKRYRRQDEIGTPYCVTVDYQTLEDNSVTIRDRDLGGQRRVAVDAIASSVS